MPPSQPVRQAGGRYADEPDIALSSGKAGGIHKWLIAAILFGARISGALAISEELVRLTGKKPLAVAPLKVNDLLPPAWRNTIRHATHYRLKKEDFFTFNREIDPFLQAAWQACRMFARTHR